MSEIVKVNYDEWLHKDLWTLLASISLLTDFKVADYCPKSLEEYLEVSNTHIHSIKDMLYEGIINNELHFVKTMSNKEQSNGLIISHETNIGEGIVTIDKTQWNICFNGSFVEKLLLLSRTLITGRGPFAEFLVPAQVLALGIKNNIKIPKEFLDRFIPISQLDENKLISDGHTVRTFSEIAKNKGKLKRISKEYVANKVQFEIDLGCTCDHMKLSEYLMDQIYDKIKHEFIQKYKDEDSAKTKAKKYINESVKEVYKSQKNEAAKSRIKYDNKNWKQPPPCKVHPS